MMMVLLLTFFGCELSSQTDNFFHDEISEDNIIVNREALPFFTSVDDAFNFFLRKENADYKKAIKNKITGQFKIQFVDKKDSVWLNL